MTFNSFNIKLFVRCNVKINIELRKNPGAFIITTFINILRKHVKYGIFEESLIDE